MLVLAGAFVNFFSTVWKPYLEALACQREEKTMNV